jgi:D-threo-aldose 1-dehydrogenase
MADEPTERRAIGDSGVTVTRLALGGASLGGLYREVTDEEADALLGRAWELGVRYLDTAPLYGYGTSERRIGRFLQGRARDGYVLSTKVGRLVREAADVVPGMDVDTQHFGGRNDAYYAGIRTRRIVFDYSGDGVRRSLEESLDRLGLNAVDIAYIHDPDRHWRAAIEGAYPALDRLRAEGRLRAIGVGMNQAPMLARFVRECDLDVILLANRYTLLDQEALHELLPACVRRRVAVTVAGVMNTGLLANPAPGARFDYRPAEAPLVERARRLAEVCARHGVSLRDAAIQFPLAHPAVVSLIAGVRSIEHLDEYPAAMRRDLPSGLWEELRFEGLVNEAAPVPVSPSAVRPAPD